MEDARQRVQTLAQDLLTLTEATPEPTSAQPTLLSPFVPPVNALDIYGVGAIRTFGLGGYGFGSMIRHSAADGTLQGFSTALHVLELSAGQLTQTTRRLETTYGPCVRFEGLDLHLFGMTERPRTDLDHTKLVQARPGVTGTPFTFAGCPAGSSVPEIIWVEYYLPLPEERCHLFNSVPMPGVAFKKAIVSGESGGGVYEGHITHAEIMDRRAVGYIKAQGDIENGPSDYDHFGAGSFFND